MKPSSILSFLALALPFSTATPSHNSLRRHYEVANRARADVDVHKRNSFTNARLTFYDVGLGACGIWSEPEDFIVALNVEQFGPGFPGEFCRREITIWVDGVTAVAIIADKCMACPWGGLDLSRGLFSHFAPEAQGVIPDAVWWFNY